MNGLFESRRFWLAVASVAAVVLVDAVKLPVSQEQVELIVMTFAAWIVGDSLRATKPKA